MYALTWIRTKRYKLYSDGRYFDVPHDWDERSPIEMEDLTVEQRAIRLRLQRVLDSMPAWNPRGGGAVDR